MNLKPGQMLGQYQIIAELGQGSSAVVFKAHDRSLNRFVALKVLREHLAGDATFVERFFHEARIAARLSHPNIISINQVQITAPYFIAMEWIDGESLAAILQREGRFDPARVLAILNPVADALDFAHSKQVIHRDIKPSNILVEHTGRIVLTDFGVAKALLTTQVTRTGTLLGTPAYMAPEEILEQRVTNRSDVYALGIVVFEMLAGVPPFRGDSALVVLHQHTQTPPPPLRALNPQLSAQVESTVNKALAKQPAQRPASAGEFARNFARALQPNSALSLPVPALVGLGAALALVVLILFFVILNNARQNVTPSGVTPPQTTLIPDLPPTATWTALPIETQIPPTDQPIASGLNTPQIAPTVVIVVPTETPTQTAISTELPSSTPVPPTETPKPTATSTRVPTRVPTRALPTVIPPPTAVPTPSIAPNIYVTALRLEPASPRREQPVTFFATFLNTLGAPNDVVWAVRIRGPNNDSKFALTRFRRDKIAPNQSEAASENDWSVKGPGGCLNFYAIAVFQNDKGEEVSFPSLGDRATRIDFQVCPP